MKNSANQPRVAIACGGTGGHIFPGLAVAAQLLQRGCAVTLLISPKDVDQQAVKKVSGVEIFVLPAVGLNRGGKVEFLRGFVKSFFRALKIFRAQSCQAVLAMGGFTAAPPVFAARLLGVPAFLHDSNMVPGRANLLLSRFVKQAFVGFPEAARRLHTSNVITTGTPVRPQFVTLDAAVCRAKLGLKPAQPVVLVMGGSQGASGINDLALAALPLLARSAPGLQWLHLAGPKDFERIRQAHAALGGGNHSATVLPFLAEMELALGAATVAVSRAGASSLAEIAAMRVPAVLIPFPAATDNHQFFNAKAFESSNAACVLEQKEATPEKFAALIADLVKYPMLRERMQNNLPRWHKPDAAGRIADSIFDVIVRHLGKFVPRKTAASDSCPGLQTLCLGDKDLSGSGCIFRQPFPAGRDMKSESTPRVIHPLPRDRSELDMLFLETASA